MRVKPTVRWMTALCLYLGAAVAPASADPPKAFPDEWFFDGAQRPAPLKAIEGKPASALSIASWIGSEVSVKESRGKVMVVDFWATWCGPCMASIPHNVELVKSYGEKGLVFVGVHDSNNGWDRAPGVVKDKGINYPVGVDKSGASVKDYAVQFWPTYVAIDRAGVVRAAGLLPDRVEDVVKALLSEDAPAGETRPAEFTPDHFYGGAARPAGLRELEGKPAPRLQPREWIGTDPGDSPGKNSVMVITFVSPSLKMSMGELDKVSPVLKEMASQGVVLLGVCDGRAEWKVMQDYAKARSLAMPIMQDRAEKVVGDAAGTNTLLSVTAAAYHIEHYPATVVIDRSGTVRAAGVKADKVKAVVEKLLGEQSGAGKASADDK